MNAVKTVILMLLLSVLIVWIGGLVGGRAGAAVALLVAIGVNAFSYFFSDSFTLAMANAVSAEQAGRGDLVDQVRALCLHAGLPMPRVYVSPSSLPNAFAAGRSPKHAIVVVNEGLLDRMDRRQIDGVLAHELSHIKHRDILIATIAASMAGAITWLAQALQWGLLWGGASEQEDRRDSHWISEIALMVLAPIAATLIQLSISRSREFAADAGAARLTRDPEGLASALLALESHAARPVYEDGSDRPMAAAMAHMYIVNPLSGQSIFKLFSTHPPTEERVRRLRQMRVG